MEMTSQLRTAITNRFSRDCMINLILKIENCIFLSFYDYDNQSESASMVRKVSSPRSSKQGAEYTTFSKRPFNMSAMDDVR